MRWRLGIEAADRFQRVAEKIEPHRLVHARRKQIDDAAAHRVVARLAHGRGAHEPVEIEPAHDVVHAQDVAGRGGQRLRRDGAFAGTRWSTALTVVNRIDGFSRPFRRESRDSVVMRCATTPACGETRS